MVESAPKRVVVTVESEFPNRKESPLNITLVQSVARGEKMDFILQKAVELGVTRVVPVLTERCGVKLAAAERIETRMEHWTSVLESAGEQCGRCVVPELSAPLPIAQWLKQLAEADKKELRLFLHPASESPTLPARAPGNVTLLIGSEGGFTDEELNLAKAHAFAPMRLGPRILRTETAPLAALAILQARYGDLLK